MLLVADSGSTKTDWRLVDDSGLVHQFRTSGINPVFHTREDIQGSLIKEHLIEFVIQHKEKVTDIHFYGAGCSGEEKKNRVHYALSDLFPEAVCTIEHDLLAAARALCGRQAGIACILGTGSNSCYYDGATIIQQTPSLGYILGDEGSGAYLGKEILRRFIYGELPKELQDDFASTYQLSREKVVEHVYRMPNANRFIASFVPFLLKHKNEPEIAQLVVKALTDFVEHQLLPYRNQPVKQVHSTGSVGYYFMDFLKHACNRFDFSLGTVTESPIAGLLLYHRENRLR